MLKNPALPSWKFFPHEKFPRKKILPLNPPYSPSTRKEYPLKMSVYFPIANTMCKQWTNVITCSPFLRGLWGIKPSSKKQLLDVFDYAEQNGYLKILTRWLWENNERGRGSSCPKKFWSLKKGTRTSNICLNEPFREILGSLGRYDHPWEK